MKEIDRGLSYRCGGVHGLGGEYGCGGFYCFDHMKNGRLNQLCLGCYEDEEKICEEMGEE
jgi:hypothetical protein